MSEYARSLGNAVKAARSGFGLTQNEVANAINIDTRTVLNIENYKGNPKMEILYPLVRTLKIDPRDIFYPESTQSTPSLQQLRMLIEGCNEQEAAALIPVLNAVISVIRSKNAIEI
jgi:DNA-binding XRE family transcriptional regulator